MTSSICGSTVRASTLLLLVVTTSLHAQSAIETIDDLDSPVAKGSPITWHMLVANVFKGIHDDTDSRQWVTASEKVLRQIGTKDRTILAEGSPLVSFDALRVRADGKRYIALLIEAESDETEHPGGGAAVLAIYPEGSADALDVADVKEDMFCNFADRATITLGPDDGFFVESTHNNSGQTYLITTLFEIHGGRLQPIDSIFTLNVRSTCGRSFDEDLKWHTENDPHDSHPTIIATVTRSAEPDETDDCYESIKPVTRRVFTEHYRYGKANGRYKSTGGNMDELGSFNEKHF